MESLPEQETPHSSVQSNRALLTLCILCLTVPNLIWLLHDHTVWPWDQAWYGEVTLDLFDAERHGPVAWGSAMLAAMGSKPPLLPWLAQAFVPLQGAFGGLEPALLFFNVICAMTTLGFVYATARRIGASPLASLAGTAICGGASLFIGMTNQFLVEPLQMLCAAFMLFLAASFERMSIVRLCTLLLLGVAASFLIKSSSFTFIVPVLTYLAVVGLLSISRPIERPRTSLLDAGLIFIALFFAAGAIGWYATNWTAMKAHFVDATSNNDVALLYGSVGPLATKALFWIRSLGQALSPSPWLPILVAFIACVALLLATYRAVVHVRVMEWPRKAMDSGLLFGGLVAGLIVVNLYGLSTIVNEETRFLAPLLPAVGILTGWALAILRQRIITFLLALAASLNAMVGMAYSFGTNPLGITPSVWLKPYQSDATARHRLEQAVAMSCGRPSKLQIVGVEYASFNANSAAFYSAQQRLTRGYRCYYTSLGYAETDVAKAMTRLQALDPDYFITISPDRQVAADAFNRISLPVAQKLLHDPRFRKVLTNDPMLLVLAHARLSK